MEFDKFELACFCLVAAGFCLIAAGFFLNNNRSES